MFIWVFGAVLFLITSVAPQNRQSIYNTESGLSTPKEEYLQQWAEKLVKLNAKHRCRDVPKVSEEETAINETCYPSSKDALCSNIFLFSEIRYLCQQYSENKQTLREGLEDIYDDYGLQEFANLPMKTVYEELAEKTKMTLSYYIVGEMEDLMMDVLDEEAKKMGFTKKIRK